MSSGELEAIAAAAVARDYRAGEAALVEDGPPAAFLFVVRSGAMELVHADQVVDVLVPGACFGHPSLLTGMAPAFTTRAAVDTGCLLIPDDVALLVFSHPSGARYIASTLRQRLVRTGYAAHALPALSMTRLGGLVHRPPLILPAGTSIRDAAAAMTAEHATAALVEMRDGLNIVTDRDLRERVLAQGRSPDEPISIAVRPPGLELPADRTAGEALVDLLDAQEREACVIGSDGRIVGILSTEDIAGGEHSPFALRRAIARAPDEDALAKTMRAGLPQLLSSLLSAGLAPADVCRTLAVQSDTATVRLLELAFARHGSAPVPWAWLALGSVARRELTLASDQDNAMAYADEAGLEADGFFARVAADVNAGLARCGLGEDQAEVLARDPRWRMSQSRWLQVFRECLERPDRSHLVRAAVAFDFRLVVGGLDVVPSLVEVIRDARQHPGFIRRMARTVTDLKVPVGRRGQIVTERDGHVDLKLGGALPIANVARLHAFAAGVTISGTIDRLVAAEGTGLLEPGSAVALREAFAAVSLIRLEHHLDCLAAGRPADNRVDPRDLPPLRRAGLREALRAVQGAQRRLGIYAPMGM